VCQARLPLAAFRLAAAALFFSPFTMNLAPTVDCHDPIRYEYALELATEDLRRIATSLAVRYISASLTHDLSWPLLLEIEEQAFSDLAFQSRNDPAIVDALPRIGPATLPGVDFSGLID